ncbi:MAG TPA: hypothetical protein VF041_13560 [Gemmatimonadaceae bacterium]
MRQSGGPSASPAVEAPRDAMEERGASAAGGARRAGGAAAIIVCHGMGQQVQFETLNAVAAALWRKQSDEPMRPDAVRVRYVAFGDDWLPRVEMTVDAGGATREVHLYEAYWAPITEGKVGLGDVFAFLLRAGARGLRYGMRGAFDRWMFGGLRPFGLPARGTYALALALASCAALALLYVAFAPLVLARALALLYPALPSGTALRLLAAAAWWCASAVALLAACGALGSWLAGLAGAPAGGRESAPRPGLGARLFAVTAAALAALGALAASTAAARVLPAALARLTSGLGPATSSGGALALLAGGAIALAALRRYLVQYVGDVAAYVSAHEVSRFQEMRREIQAVGRRVARNVYGAREGVGGALQYRDVIVVGHSLGSVIAYDMLDDSINRDLLLASTGGGAARLHVAERTALLITCGSPLDKTAFLFRAQKDDLPVREALAGAVQPMIVDYANRPARWINLWSPWDWISGSLEYYDASPVPAAHARRAVRNVRLAGGPRGPVRAHVQYWSRGELGEALFAALAGDRAGGPRGG